jgi:hypothetical protein
MISASHSILTEPTIKDNIDHFQITELLLSVLGFVKIVHQLCLEQQNPSQPYVDIMNLNSAVE